MSVFVTITLRVDDGFWFTPEEIVEYSDKGILEVVSEDPIASWNSADKKVIRNAD